MTGIGVFDLLNHDTANYHEDVAVQLSDGPVLDSARDYVFKRLATGFSVYFKDTNQLFHNMEFFEKNGILTASAGHLCAADKYESTYRFNATDQFEVIHKVFGPRKDYRIHSLYSRAD